MEVEIQDYILTNSVSNKLEKLIVNFENTMEYEIALARLDSIYDSVRECLQKEDFKLLIDLDDCIIELLIIYEEYFYKEGYKDGIKSKGIFKKLLAWFELIEECRRPKGPPALSTF